MSGQMEDVQRSQSVVLKSDQFAADVPNQVNQDGAAGGTGYNSSSQVLSTVDLSSSNDMADNAGSSGGHTGQKVEVQQEKPVNTEELLAGESQEVKDLEKVSN